MKVGMPTLVHASQSAPPCLFPCVVLITNFMWVVYLSWVGSVWKLQIIFCILDSKKKWHEVLILLLSHAAIRIMYVLDCLTMVFCWLVVSELPVESGPSREYCWNRRQWKVIRIISMEYCYTIHATGSHTPTHSTSIHSPILLTVHHISLDHMRYRRVTLTHEYVINLHNWNVKLILLYWFCPITYPFHWLVVKSTESKTILVLVGLNSLPCVWESRCHYSLQGCFTS